MLWFFFLFFLFLDVHKHDSMEAEYSIIFDTDAYFYVDCIYRIFWEYFQTSVQVFCLNYNSKYLFV